ncbi:hypothetical protein [Jidongwangia harbinensis]|nr:hypothetical protein [Jidongwangia harbinensis]
MDINKIILGGQFVVVAGMLLARAMLRARSTPRRLRTGGRRIGRH